MPGVKALGLEIPQRRMSQVSMNLTNYKTTSVKAVFERISRLAEEGGGTVVESELVGLIPRDALEGISPEQLLLRGFDGSQILENKIADLG
jgi:glutamate formiminotransferase